MAIVEFKVILGHQLKAVCDFLLMNNDNLRHISQSFKVTADYWSNCPFR